MFIWFFVTLVSLYWHLHLSKWSLFQTLHIPFGRERPSLVQSAWALDQSTGIDRQAGLSIKDFGWARPWQFSEIGSEGSSVEFHSWVGLLVGFYIQVELLDGPPGWLNALCGQGINSWALWSLLGEWGLRLCPWQWGYYLDSLIVQVCRLGSAIASGQVRYHLLFSCAVMSNSLWPHGLQLIRPPCPSPSPRVFPSSCSLHWWCHPAISCSDTLFSFCPQSFPASGTFPMSSLFASDDQNTGASALASVFSVNI